MNVLSVYPLVGNTKLEPGKQTNKQTNRKEGQKNVLQKTKHASVFFVFVSYYLTRCYKLSGGLTLSLFQTAAFLKFRRFSISRR